MGTRQKQEQIRHYLRALNWSYKRFAEVVYGELYEDDEAEDIEISPTEKRKLIEKIKKQLSRETTSIELLDRYLKALANHSDFQALKLNKVDTTFRAHQCINPQLRRSSR